MARLDEIHKSRLFLQRFQVWEASLHNSTTPSFSAPIFSMISFTVIIAIVVFLHSAVALGPAAINLHSAINYVILAQTGVSTVPSSAITGNVGLSPAAGTFFTGFSLTPFTTYSTSTQVTGELFAANYNSPTPSTLTTAISDEHTAYNDGFSRLNPNFTNLGAGAIGGLTLTPGLYKWTTGVSIGSDVIIEGGALDVWIFQISGTLIEAANQEVILSGGAVAKNVFWVVSGAVTIGSDAEFVGILLGGTSVTFDTGASITGRIFAQTAVTLQQATVTHS